MNIVIQMQLSEKQKHDYRLKVYQRIVVTANQRRSYKIYIRKWKMSEAVRKGKYVPFQAIWQMQYRD